MLYNSELWIGKDSAITGQKAIAMDDKTIDAAAKALLDAAPAGSRVILFGSYARGTARPDSDLDFLVIEPIVEDRFGEMFRLREIVDVVFGDDVQPVDILVTDEAHFRRSEKTPNTLSFEAAAEGRVYE
jgi:predicted nucleotidyltransferase